MDAKKVEIPCTEWIWHGRAAHFICAADCLFHMVTEIGDHVISTVGDLHLYEKTGGRGSRREIGCGRTYETYVFRKLDGHCECGCGLPSFDLSEVDSEGANDDVEARSNHMLMCHKYARIGAPA